MNGSQATETGANGTTTSWTTDLVPRLRTDFVRRVAGSESVVWSPAASEPVALDPLATVMLDVVDGEATIGTLALEVAETIGVPLETALRQVTRIIELFEQAALLLPPGNPVIAYDQIAHPDLFVSPPTPCSEDASRLGTVTLVLRLGEQTIRVACDSRRGARKLRAALAGDIVDDTYEAPLGFVLTAPQGLKRKHKLVDRAGFVLSEDHGLDSGLRALASHLTAFLMPAPGTVRIRARGILAGRRMIVFLDPLLYFPTVAERDLHEMGLQLVDRLALDLELGSGRIVNPEIPWSALRVLRSGGTHGSTEGAISAAAIVTAAPPGSAPPTHAGMAASIAARGLSGTAAELLDAAIDLVTGTELRAISPAPEEVLGLLREFAPTN